MFPVFASPGARMTSANAVHITQIASLLRSLRDAFNKLEQFELAHVKHLTGDQTVDSRQSLSQCFANFQNSITDMENGLASMAEATGEISEL
jgi:hypothetical protein